MRPGERCTPSQAISGGKVLAQTDWYRQEDADVHKQEQQRRYQREDHTDPHGNEELRRAGVEVEVDVRIRQEQPVNHAPEHKERNKDSQDDKNLPQGDPKQPRDSEQGEAQGPGKARPPACGGPRPARARFASRNS